MSLTFEDKVIIKHYGRNKRYGIKRLLKEFPEKGWCKDGLERFFKKIGPSSDGKRKAGWTAKHFN